MAKTAGRPQAGAPNVGPTQDELQTAYQVHTLAQMLYGQLAAAHPWADPVQPMGATDPTAMGTATAPWAQGWPACYCGPFGHVAPTGFYWTGPSQYFGSGFFPR